MVLAQEAGVGPKPAILPALGAAVSSRGGPPGVSASRPVLAAGMAPVF